jgi:hypothetical protein
MAQEIVIFTREKFPEHLGGGFRVTGMFLYEMDPVLETKTPGNPKTIAPTPSVAMPTDLRIVKAFFSPDELLQMDEGRLVYEPFIESISAEMASDLPGAGVAFLREVYIELDPRARHRYDHRFSGVRVDAV